MNARVSLPELALGVAAVVAAAAGGFVVAKFAMQHLVGIVTIAVTGLVIVLVILRLTIGVLNRFTIRTYRMVPPAAAKPKPQPSFPDPLDADAAPAAERPFTSTQAAWPEPAWPHTVAPPGECEGPECTATLPVDEDDRWRCGTGPEGEPGDTHDFCTEACMRAWITQDLARQGR